MYKSNTSKSNFPTTRWFTRILTVQDMREKECKGKDGNTFLQTQIFTREGVCVSANDRTRHFDEIQLHKGVRLVVKIRETKEPDGKVWLNAEEITDAETLSEQEQLAAQINSLQSTVDEIRALMLELLQGGNK